MTDGDLTRDQAQKILDAALEALAAREAKTFRLYYGLSGERRHSPDEIGNMLGLPREDTRTLIREATLNLLSGPEGIDGERAMEVLGLAPRDEDELEGLTSVTPLTVLIDPGDATSEDLAELYSALSELYRAYGGHGIAFRSEETEIGFLAGAP